MGYGCFQVVYLKDRKDITVTNVFKKFLLNWVLNPTKYDQVKVVNFTVDQ